MKAGDVLAIFRSNFSEEVYDRKAREVCIYLESRKDGFIYNELPELTEITVDTVYPQSFVLNDLIKGYVKEMKGPFIRILQNAKMGFKKEKIFDDRIKFDYISKFLNVLL